MKTASLIGYIDLHDDENVIEKALRRVIVDLIENKGVNKFISSGFGRFEDICARIVRGFKGVYHDGYIKMYMVAPDCGYYGGKRDYDGFIFPPMENGMTAEKHLNKWLYENPDYVISFADKTIKVEKKKSTEWE